MLPSTHPRMGLAPSRTTLDNGVVVIAKETRKTPAVALQLALRAGSIWDPAHLLGATHLLSRVIDRGTRSRSSEEIAAELDDRGVSLSIAVTRHLLSLSCTCLAEDFRDVFALLGEIVMAPSVPESELAVRRGEVLTGLRQDEDNPAIRAVEKLMAVLYGDEHLYGRPARGTAESIERIARADLLALHAAAFKPDATMATVVGDVEAAEVVDAAAAIFSGWRGTTIAAPSVTPPVPATMRQRIVIPMMNKAQTDIAYGFTTITRNHPDYFPLHLLNNVLGQYAMGGRLGDSIRERQGMAYYASSSFDPSIAAGPLVVRAGVSAANVERAIASIDEEISAVVREGVTAKEQAESTEYLIGALPRQLETNAGIANFLQTAEFFGLGMDYDVTMPERLRAVTADDLRAVAVRYLDPGRAAIVVAGPYREL